ncbi:hypothetical protein J5N97_016591 [Dioscorea zingiberensis]|uniref:Uncharacterized protein n=1 Tax=Dioscorea zingiberensis TaxID=325984 RepID=A0A9D5HFB6_9LILI|nr:hypothetical protein J5N97_016591 [Dioscorea zingiberensis]
MGPHPIEKRCILVSFLSYCLSTITFTTCHSFFRTTKHHHSPKHYKLALKIPCHCLFNFPFIGPAKGFTSMQYRNGELLLLMLEHLL